MDKLTEEQKQIEEIIDEFRKMRSLMGYGQIWKYHPMGVSLDIENFLRNKISSLLQKEREAGKREGIEEGGYGGRMEAMNLLIERYRDNGWLVNDLNDIKSGKVKDLPRLSLWSEGNDRLKSQLLEKGKH